MARRERQIPEDASTLQLGPDFSESYRCLWNSEVALVVKHRIEMAKTEDKDSQPPESTMQMLQETLAYVELFDNYAGDKNAIDECRKAMKKYEEPEGKLHKFEIACLNNLLIDSEEQALALIPTLREKFQDDPDGLKRLLADFMMYQKKS